VTRAVLITGAGARVGAHFATGLAKDGWAVAIHYNRSEDGASALAAQICSAGGTAKIVQANLAVPQDVDSLIARAAEALGTPLSALINNASTFSPDTANPIRRFSLIAQPRRPCIGPQKHRLKATPRACESTELALARRSRMCIKKQANLTPKWTRRFYVPPLIQMPYWTGSVIS